MKKLAYFASGILLIAIVSWGAAVAQEKSAAGPITGSWDCTSRGGPEGDVKFSLELQQDGEKVTGSVDSALGGMDLTSGKFKDDTLELRLDTPQGNYVLIAKLKDGKLTGDVKIDDKPQGTWEGKKAAAPEK